MKRLSSLSSLIFLAALLSTAQDNTPVQEGSEFIISAGNLVFRVDAQEGAKVSSLTIDGDEFMVTADMVSSYFLWGSTLWPSPQKEWAWRPDNFHWDHHPYESAIEADTMVFTGPDAAVDNGDQFHFVKRFWSTPQDTIFSLHYAMVNTTGKSIKKGLWELTRVPVGGLTFWPTGPGGTWGALAVATEEINGHTWYERELEDGFNLKFFADGKDGWYAHVDDLGRIFVKTFEDVDQKDFAEGEGEIELWVANEYIELENQGVCLDIPDGDTLDYHVKWYLRHLPDPIEVSAGNMDLVDYVEALISGRSDPTSNGRPEQSLAHVRLSPNPARDRVRLITHTGGLVPYAIYNVAGSVVREGHAGQENINLAGLEGGVYIVRVRLKGMDISRKLLIR
jgi:hypothetical protein